MEQIYKPSLVGRDLEGNKYYEIANPESSRMKRVVKYRKGYDMWTYVAGGKRLPVQWSAWLTHTRAHPPTLEELYADIERQKRVMLGAAMIEAREREAVVAAQLAEQPSISAHRSDSSSVEPLPSSQTSPPNSQQESREVASGTWQGKPDPFAHVPKGADQTQSWAPRAIRRG
ncbi:hypothetical protein EIP91_009668 [Steccherinum ochraceum]|uniref:NADH dehydrogenase [ubiquinone] 1 alpha subcomplex subunit n=1 Tax=Steccherinum ochraceum TaxID=92696 RepID=A0A4R0R3M2_9APHY|nr:hypothetical protein EIP91_009668 [Steccherinum ochraceum]